MATQKNLQNFIDYDAVVRYLYLKNRKWYSHFQDKKLPILPRLDYIDPTNETYHKSLFYYNFDFVA